MTARVISFLLLLLVAVPGQASAQEAVRIAAVVNDQAITLHDLEARMMLAMLSSNLPDTPEVRRRVGPQVLRKLIDERLQIQEAERLKINIGNEEVAAGVARIEQQNRMPPGTFEKMLRSKGVDPATVHQQVRAEIGWARVVRRTVGGSVKVGEEEVQARLDQLRANLGRPEYQVSEIFLAVDVPEADDDARKLAERLSEQLKQGAPINGLARQFSQSPTAAMGGDLGWVGDEDVEPEVAAALPNLASGGASSIVRSSIGYHVVVVRNKRVAGEGTKETLYSIAQVTLPAGKDRKAAQQNAQKIAQEAKSCEDMGRFAKQMGGPDSGLAEGLRGSELPPQVRQIVGSLKIGQTGTDESQMGYRVLMVCGRQETGGEGGLPSAGEIQQRLENERTEMLARRYLRDLRRQAFIDIRV